MSNTFSKTFAATLFTATLALTGCAVGTEDPEGAQLQEPQPEETAEQTGTVSEALQIGGGGVGGSTSLWCACKLDCDNTYSGIPVLIKACKKQCDDNNKCRKGVVGGGGLIIAQ